MVLSALGGFVSYSMEKKIISQAKQYLRVLVGRCRSISFAIRRLQRCRVAIGHTLLDNP